MCVFQVSKLHKDTVTEWVDLFVTLKLRRVNIRGHKGKCCLTTVIFWAIPQVQSSLSKQQWILQQVGLFGTCLCYLLCNFTGDQCKGQEYSGAPGSQVQRWVPCWQSCSSDQLHALFPVGMTSAAETALGFWSIWWEVPEQEGREDSKTRVGTRL